MADNLTSTDVSQVFYITDCRSTTFSLKPRIYMTGRLTWNNETSRLHALLSFSQGLEEMVAYDNEIGLPYPLEERVKNNVINLVKSLCSYDELDFEKQGTNEMFLEVKEGLIIIHFTDGYMFDCPIAEWNDFLDRFTV